MTAVKLKLVEEETKSPAVPATKARSTRTSKVASGSVPAPKSPAKKKAPAPKVQKRETYAADLMTATPIYCHMNDSLNEAARQMWENNVGAIAIVNDAKMPVAMLTDRDICVAAYTQGRPLYECGVASAMSKTLVSCATDTPLSEVRDLMAEEKVRRLPVVDKQGVLVGMLGFSDLMEEAHMDLPKDRKRGSTGPMLVQMVHAVLKDERS